MFSPNCSQADCGARIRRSNTEVHKTIKAGWLITAGTLFLIARRWQAVTGDKLVCCLLHDPAAAHASHCNALLILRIWRDTYEVYGGYTGRTGERTMTRTLKPEANGSDLPGMVNRWSCPKRNRRRAAVLSRELPPVLSGHRRRAGNNPAHGHSQFQQPASRNRRSRGRRT
jgi:hypothetical protein